MAPLRDWTLWPSGAKVGERPMTDVRYARLLEPGQIGKVKTRNRIYKSGAGMMSFHENETRMNDTTLGYYEALARGGAGVVTVEAPTIDYPLGARWRERYRLDEDRFIPGMAELVDLIHRYGCPTFMQMEHDGPWQSPLFDNAPAIFEGPPIAASPVNIPKPGDFHRDVPRALTIPEIKEITRKYIDGAERAQKAGFDGVDINAGSSHIIHNFLSPFWNRRNDEYGGTHEKRARLLVDIVTGIKGRCGADFPIVVCLNGIESGYCIGVDDRTCLTHDLALQTMRMAVEAGADALMIRSHWLGLHVPGFLPDYMFFPDAQVPVDKMPPQYYAKERGRAAMRTMTEEAKKLFPVPIILIGYVTPEQGEQMLRQGKADFIGMNRPLICDPLLPTKLAEGRPEDVAECNRCGTCLDQSESFLRHCRVNAAVGFGYQKINPAPVKKKVVVVGGGPAGMEAARVAALRGHDVTLIEKSSRLGGLLPLASLIKGLELENLPGLVRYLERQITKATGDGAVDRRAEARCGHPCHGRGAHLAGGRTRQHGERESRYHPRAAPTGEALLEGVRPQVPGLGHQVLPADRQEGRGRRRRPAWHGDGRVPGQAQTSRDHRGAHRCDRRRGARFSLGPVDGLVWPARGAGCRWRPQPNGRRWRRDVRRQGRRQALYRGRHDRAHISAGAER
jgi:2,4-dienoyl-CoA reductase (NADPH2)